MIFASARAGGSSNLFQQAANHTGSAERLTTSPILQFPMSISPDGTRLLDREDAPSLNLRGSAGTAQAPPMVVVLNWLEELQATLPAK